MSAIRSYINADFKSPIQHWHSYKYKQRRKFLRPYLMKKTKSKGEGWRDAKYCDFIHCDPFTHFNLVNGGACIYFGMTGGTRVSRRLYLSFPGYKYQFMLESNPGTFSGLNISRKRQHFSPSYMTQEPPHGPRDRLILQHGGLSPMRSGNGC